MTKKPDARPEPKKPEQLRLLAEWDDMLGRKLRESLRITSKHDKQQG